MDEPHRVTVLPSTTHRNTTTAQACTTAQDVFNKAFYHLATTQGWDTKKRSNFSFLAAKSTGRSSDFWQGACGVKNSATDLGYSTEDVVSTFTGWGVTPCDERPPLPPEPEYQRLENGIDTSGAGTKRVPRLTLISKYQKAKTNWRLIYLAVSTSDQICMSVSINTKPTREHL